LGLGVSSMNGYAQLENTVSLWMGVVSGAEINMPPEKDSLRRARKICTDRRHGIPAIEIRRKQFDCKECCKIAAVIDDAVASEREGCAVVAEKWKPGKGYFDAQWPQEGIVKAIRNRGKCAVADSDKAIEVLVETLIYFKEFNSEHFRDGGTKYITDSSEATLNHPSVRAVRERGKP